MPPTIAEALARAACPSSKANTSSPFASTSRCRDPPDPPDTADRLLPDGRYTRRASRAIETSRVSATCDRSSPPSCQRTSSRRTRSSVCERRYQLEASHFLCGILNSFVMNLVVRMLMGGHVTTSLAEQLPVPVVDGGHQPTADCATGGSAGSLAVDPTASRRVSTRRSRRCTASSSRSTSES